MKFVFRERVYGLA